MHLRQIGTAVLAAAVLVLPGLATASHSSAQPVGPSQAGANAGSSSGPLAGSLAGDRPNIVMVMADDMRADDLLFAPRIRRLVARTGLTYDNSFSNYPLCCPARASFLTGRYAHNHRVYSHVRPYGYRSFDDSETLATALKRSGYRTGFVGKYLNGYGRDKSRVSKRPSLRYVPNGWSDWRASLEPPAGSGLRGSTYNYRSTPYNVNGKIDARYAGKYQTNVLGDFSVDMAGRFSRSTNPFFMYVNYVAPHFGGPGEVDDPGKVRDKRGRTFDYRTPARPAAVRGKFDRLIKRASGLPRTGKSEAKNGDQPKFYRSLTEPNRAEKLAMREVTRQRAEAIWVLDQQVGRLIAKLKRTGEWDNTVFMFTSDNGYYLGEHRVRTGKIRPHDPSFRVPFLVTGPGARGGAHRTDPISTVDINATILDLAGARSANPVDGVSVVPSFAGSTGWDRGILYEATHTGGKGSVAGISGPRTGIGLRTYRYMYVRNRSGKDMLYDMVRDPLQNTNLATSASYAGVRRSLDQVWRRLATCSGAACRVDLPPDLAGSKAQVDSATSGYWRTLTKVYGHRR